MRSRLSEVAASWRLPRLRPIFVLPAFAAMVVANPAGLFQAASGTNAVDGTEYQSQTSFRNATGSITSASKHVFQIQTILASGGGIFTQVGNNSTHNNGISGGGSATASGTATATGTGTTGGFQWQGTVTGTDCYLEVTNPTESPSSLATVSNVVVNSSGATLPGLRVCKIRNVFSTTNGVVLPAGYGNGVTTGSPNINLAAIGNISGGGITTVDTEVAWQETWISYDDQTWSLSHRTESTTIRQVRQDFTVGKLIANNAAIDTRTEYGQPDASGAPPIDPNAPSRNVNFGGWVYRGGMFVGNAPTLTGDRSGYSRIQLWPQGTTGLSPNCFSTFTAFYLRTAPNFDGNITIDAYTPNPTTEPNLGTTESNLTWANRWTTIVPGTNPLYSVNFTPASMVNDYYNFHLGQNQPVSTLSYLALANNQEASFFTNNTSGWRYFTTKEYTASLPATPAPVFPFTDCAPRLWVVTFNGPATSWTAPNTNF